jgi:hypothetical protein
VQMLFDRLVTGQVVPHNTAAAVRGPKYAVHTGKTPVLDAVEPQTGQGSRAGLANRCERHNFGLDGSQDAMGARSRHPGCRC